MYEYVGMYRYVDMKLWLALMVIGDSYWGNYFVVGIKMLVLIVIKVFIEAGVVI